MGKAKNPQKTPVDPASPEDESATNNNTSNGIKTIQSDEQNIAQQSTEDGIDPNAAESVNSVYISFRGQDSAETDKTKFLNINDVATIEPVNGFDGSYTTNGNVEFLVKANPGWAGLAAGSVTAEYLEEDGKTWKDIAVSGNPASEKCTITTNKGRGFVGELRITVTTSKIKNTLKIDGDTLKTDVYLLGTFDGAKDQEINGTGKALSYDGLFNKEASPIRIAVPKAVFASAKNGKIQVKINDGSAKDLTKSGETAEVDSKECVVFTFKPYEVNKTEAENTENTAVSYELSFSNSVGNSALYIKTGDETGKYTFTAAPTSGGGFGDETYYTYSSPTINTEQNTGLKKDDYREDASNKKGRKVAFQVTPVSDKGIKIAKVYAELKKRASDESYGEALQTILAKELTWTATGGTRTYDYYVIDLSEINDDLFTQDMVLDVKVDTEFLEESDYEKGFEKHKVEFTGVLETVEIYKSTTSTDFNTYAGLNGKKLQKNPAENDDVHIYFAIVPKEGYAIKDGTNHNKKIEKVVSVSYEKVYCVTGTDSKKYYFKDTVTGEETDLTLVQTQGEEDYWRTDLELCKTSNFTGGTFTAELKDKAIEQNRLGSSTTVFNNVSELTGWTLKNVKINIETELESNKRGAVTIKGIDPDMSCDISGTGVTRVEDEDVWEIGEDADLLTLTVNSSVKPTITYENSKSTDKKVETSTAAVSGAAGTYTAKIPVSLLRTEKDNDGNDVIKAVITVGKATQNLRVWDTWSGGAGTLDFSGSIKVVGPKEAFPATVSNRFKDGEKVTYDEVEVGGTSDKVVLTSNKEVTVTLYAQAGSLFKKITYKFGKEEEKTENWRKIITSEDGVAEATFTMNMTDDVDIRTETKATYRYVVTYRQGGTGGIPAVSEGSGVYAVPAGVKDVKIEVYDDTTTDNTGWAGVYNARAFHGSSVAACTVALDGTPKKNIINLGLNSEKDGEMVVVKIKGQRAAGGVGVFSLDDITIRQDKMAESVAIKDADGKQIDSVTLLPGDKKGPYTVEVTSGSMSFMDGNIGMEIARNVSRNGERSSAAVDSAGCINVDLDGIIAKYDTKRKKLYIEGDGASKKGNDAPVTLRFYDVAKRNSGTGASESEKLGIIAGSSISVKLDNPAVSLVTPQVAANNTVYNLQLTLSTPGFEDDKDIWYRVSIGGGNVVEPNIGGGEIIKEEVKQMKTPYVGENKSLEGGREIWVKKSGSGQEIRIPVNYKKDAKGVYEEKQQSYTVTVELAQKSSAALVDAALKDKEIWEVGNPNLVLSQATKIETKTAKAVYPTGLFLSGKVDAVYTGQDGQRIANASFVGDAECVRLLSACLVDAKTGVKVSASTKAAWARYGVDGFLSVNTDLDGNVYLNAAAMNASKTLPKDLGVKISAYAGGANEVFEIVPLKFVNGVGRISFENGSNRVLYRQDGKKATSKLTAVVNNGNGVKTQNANRITYSRGDANGNESGDKAYSLSANLEANVSVNPKNGTVTVSKDYVYGEKDNKFSVIARVAGTDVGPAKVYVTISQTAQEMGGLVIVDGNNKVVARGESVALGAEQFISKDLYVKALNTGAVQTNSSYEEKDYAGGIGFTSGNTKALTIDKTNGKLALVGASGKAVKITAVNTDGSKKVKKEMLVTLSGPKSLGVKIRESYEQEDLKLAGYVYAYSGAMQEKFVVIPGLYVNGKVEDMQKDYYKNLKITVKGAKKTDKTALDGTKYFELVKSAPETTVTISDKTDKSVAPVTYTIKQDPETPVKGKALNIKTVTKLTEAALNDARNAAAQKDGVVKIEFQISGKNAGDYDGKYVMLTPDYSQTRLVNKIAGTENYKRASRYFLGGSGELRAKISDGGKFTVALDMWKKADQERIPDTYKLVAAIGQNGAKGKFDFVDGLKATTVSVKIPGKMPKELGLKTNGTYSISASGGEVPFNTGVSSAYSWRLDGDANNYALNAVGADGSVNRFKDFFEIKESSVAGEYVIGMKKNVLVADLEDLAKNEKNRVGFVKVTSYNEAGDVETVDMRVSVDVVDKDAITWKADEAFRGANAVVKLYDVSGKPLNVWAAALDKKAGTQAGVTKADKSKDGKSIEVAVGKDAGTSVKVSLKVIADGSAFATANGAQDRSDTYLQNNGDTIEVNINLADPSTAKEAAVVLGADKLAFEAKVNADTYEADYKKEENDKTKKGYDRYFRLSSKEYGLRVDMKSKVKGAKIKNLSIDGKKASAAINGRMITLTKKEDNVFMLALSQAEFLRQCAVTGSGVEKGGTITVPVIAEFTLDGMEKQAIDLVVKLPNPKTYSEAVAALEAAKSSIGSLKPDKYLAEEDEDSIANLQRKINEAFRAAVPLDTNASVSPEKIELKAPNKNGEYEQTVTIKGTGSESYEHKFTWGDPGDVKGDAEALIGEIEDMLKDNIDGKSGDGVWLEAAINELHKDKKIVDNSYSVGEFESDLATLLWEKRKVVVGENIILTVGFTKTIKATNNLPGRIYIKIAAKDGEKKDAKEYVAEAALTHLNIRKLTNLGEEGRAVKARLDALDYEQMVYDALAKTDIYGLELALENKIKEEAAAALSNKKVTVAFEKLTADSTDAGYGYVQNAEKHNVIICLPVQNTNKGELKNGYLKFKVLLGLDKMSDYVIDYGSTYKKDLKASWKGESKDGKKVTFQRLDQIKDVVEHTNNSETGYGEVLTWASSKATFVKNATIPDTSGWESVARSEVLELIGDLVNGMHLEVSVDGIKRASNKKDVEGRITISDPKKRSTISTSSVYSFDFVLSALGNLTSTYKESGLGEPRSMTEKDYERYLENNAAKKTGAPKYERLSGLRVVKTEKVAETADTVEYVVRLEGTLKYVQNWTGFGSGDPIVNGFYAGVSIPVPDALREIAKQSPDKVFMQWGKDNVTGGNRGDKDVMDLIMVLQEDGNTGRISTGKKSGVRGFKIVVDYNSISGGVMGWNADADFSTTDTKNSAGGVASKGQDYAQVTYTFDASGVTLDRSSEAIVSVASGADQTALVKAYNEDQNASIPVVDSSMDVSGSNKDSGSNVIEVTGTLTDQDLKGFDPTYRADELGYFVFVTVEAPSYLKSKSDGDIETILGKNPTLTRPWPNGKKTKMTSTSGVFTKKDILVHVNSRDMRYGKSIITFTVDWDDSGNDWTPTTYTLDLSKVEYKKAQ